MGIEAPKQQVQVPGTAAAILSAKAMKEGINADAKQDEVTPVAVFQDANGNSTTALPLPDFAPTTPTRIPGRPLNDAGDGKDAGKKATNSVFNPSEIYRNGRGESVILHNGTTYQFRHADGSLMRAEDVSPEDAQRAFNRHRRDDHGRRDIGYNREPDYDNRPERGHSSGPNLFERMLYSIPLIGPLLQSLFGGDDECSDCDDRGPGGPRGPQGGSAPGQSAPAQDTIAAAPQAPTAGEDNASIELLKDAGKYDPTKSMPTDRDEALTLAESTLQGNGIHPENIKGDDKHSAAEMKIKLADAMLVLKKAGITFKATDAPATIIKLAEDYKAQHPEQFQRSGPANPRNDRHVDNGGTAAPAKTLEDKRNALIINIETSDKNNRQACYDELGRFYAANKGKVKEIWPPKQ